MHIHMTKLVSVLLAAALVSALALPAFAQTYDPREDIPQPTGLEKSMTKLGRGVSNVLLGWGEIPMAFGRGIERGKPLGYLVGVAPVLGTARAVVRTGTGVFEVVTFPFSDRDVNYEAVLEPEYVF